jgi:UDP-N-acetylmuramoylalanine--D-glutamate ligase
MGGDRIFPGPGPIPRGGAGADGLVAELRGNRPVAILGYGVSGRALVRFCQRRQIPFQVYDQFHRGEGILNDFFPDRHRLALHSPGFLHSPWLRLAEEAGCRCLGELDFASLFLPNRTIAVTGTNGKTSTVSMLVHILQKLGQPCSALGNIGLPLIDAVDSVPPDAWNVCEVSSYQSHVLHYFAPDFLLWTNFGENHMDLHRAMGEYFLAKWNLLSRCREWAMVGDGVPQWAKRMGLKIPHFCGILQKIPRDIPARGALETEHQRCNFALVRELLQRLGFSRAAIGAAVGDFPLPAHRLRRIASVGEWAIWNDSKATNSHAVWSALRHVRGNGMPCLWISCGSSKGENLENFRKIAAASSGIIGFGAMGKVICDLFSEKAIAYLTDREELFPFLREKMGRDRTRGSILFSPGFASFDLFENFKKRGEWFERGVAAEILQKFS